jgi:hypothetical protein
MNGSSWAWPALFGLGAYHGINPAMGWLFAVALGMQERSSRAVWRALLPITIGHGLAIAVVVGLAGLLEVVIPYHLLKIGVCVTLAGLGLYYLIRRRHLRWGGMQVGFRDLTFWSFLMASAHGAGLMVLPILFKLTPRAHDLHQPMAMNGHGGAATGLLAVLVHTAGYLTVTGLVAWVVYRKLGLALLRTAWLNLDLVWAVALVGTAAFTLLL